VTLIPASVAKDVEITETAHVLTAANGTRIAVLGEVSLPFSVGEYKTVVSGLVSEHVADVVLGINWLTENQVTWEFCNSRVCIGGVYHDLRRRSDANVWCRRAALFHGVVEKNVGSRDVRKG